MHLTDEQLNEYLDNELSPAGRAGIEAILNESKEDAARLADLKILFTEIESLPEVAVSKNFASRFTFHVNPTLGLPRWLTLTVALQSALALIALIVAIPFVTTYVPQIDITSLTTPLFEIQTLWTSWLDQLFTLQLPMIPEFPIPIIEISTMLISLAGISILWILGNGLLLRNQIR